MKVHHIAYVVKDIHEVAVKFKKLGYAECGDIVIDKERSIRILFMIEAISDTLIELVEPLGEDNDVDKLLKKAKGISSLYHMCYECDKSIEETMTLLKNQGFLVVKKPLEAPAIGGRKVAFLFSKQTGLIEIVE